MHIPDGFLSNPVCAATTALAVVGLAGAAALARRSPRSTSAGATAAVAAAIFAGQMLNFPVFAATSGHLIGATLATALLGPAAAVFAMASVLVVQCALFGDGGLYALGANIFNMAIVGVGVSYVILGTGERTGGSYWARVALAAWCSTMAAAFACSLELAVPGTSSFAVVLPAMLKIHAIIGIGEALITVAVLLLVSRSVVRPTRKQVAFGLLAGLAVAALGSPWASSFPDGLERVAESLGFAGQSVAAFSAPLPDYSIPGVDLPGLSTALAGIVGTLIAFAVCWMIVSPGTWLRTVESSDSR